MFDTPRVERKVWGLRTPIYTEDTVEAYLLDLRPVDGKAVCCSFHHHEMKWNRFFVISGRLGVEHKREDGLFRIAVDAGQSYTVRPGDKHRFIVIEPARVVEVTWANKITEDICREDVGHVLDIWP